MVIKYLFKKSNAFNTVMISLVKIMELSYLKDIHLVFFYLKVNKLITDDMQNIL